MTAADSALPYEAPAADAATDVPVAATLLPPPRRDRLLILPVVAIALVVLLTASLLWLVARDRSAEARQKLTTDALWVEQYLRFQLATYERELEAMAHDFARGDPATLLSGPGVLMSESHPEIVALTLFDTAGGTLARQPPGGEATVKNWAAVLAGAALRSGRAVYGTPRQDARGPLIDIVAPATGPQGQPQALGMTISLDQLLTLNVPWWIAGRYHVALTDAGGAALATRSSIPAPEGAAAHTMSFDPPLPGVFVTLTSFEARSGLGIAALVAAILGLLALVVVSLGAVARQARHRAHAEHGLRAEHAFRKAMEESLTIGMRARARDGRVIYVNPEFCRMVGRPAGQIVGLKPPHAYWAPETVPEAMARHHRLLTSGPAPQRFETRFQRPDGSRVDALVYEAPLIGPDGAHLGWMGSVIDITDRKRAEALRAKEAERLQHSARLVTLGEMASTLAHELNQPLAAIAGYAAGSRNLLANGQGGPDDLAPILEKLEVQAGRAGAILHRVQDFARKRTTQLVPVDLGAVLATSVSFIEGDARARGVPIRLTLPDRSLRTLADPVLIEQAVLNLVRNAIEALSAQPEATRAVTVVLSAGDAAEGAQTPSATHAAEGGGAGDALDHCLSAGGRAADPTAHPAAAVWGDASAPPHAAHCPTDHRDRPVAQPLDDEAGFADASPAAQPALPTGEDERPVRQVRASGKMPTRRGPVAGDGGVDEAARYPTKGEATVGSPYATGGRCSIGGADRTAQQARCRVEGEMAVSASERGDDRLALSAGDGAAAYLVERGMAACSTDGLMKCRPVDAANQGRGEAARSSSAEMTVGSSDALGAHPPTGVDDQQVVNLVDGKTVANPTERGAGHLPVAHPACDEGQALPSADGSASGTSTDARMDCRLSEGAVAQGQANRSVEGRIATLAPDARMNDPAFEGRNRCEGSGTEPALYLTRRSVATQQRHDVFAEQHSAQYRATQSAAREKTGDAGNPATFFFGEGIAAHGPGSQSPPLRDRISDDRVDDAAGVDSLTPMRAAVARIVIADTGPGLPSDSLAELFVPFQTTKPEGMGLGLSICRSILEMHQGRLSYRPRPGGGSLFEMTLPLVTVAELAPVPEGGAIRLSEPPSTLLGGLSHVAPSPKAAAAPSAREDDR